MHSADYAVARCLSHAGIVRNRLHISSTFFSLSGSPSILVFPYQIGWQYSVPLTEVSNTRGYEKITIFDQYVGTDARQSHSYYVRRIGNRTQAFEWYHFE